MRPLGVKDQAMRLALGKFFKDNDWAPNVWCVIASRPSRAQGRHKRDTSQALYAAIKVGCVDVVKEDGNEFLFHHKPEVQFFTANGLCLKRPDLGRHSEILRLVELHEPDDPNEPDILDTLASISGGGE